MGEIRSASLSEAWLRAIETAAYSKNREVSRLVVVVDGLANTSIPEDRSVRRALDEALANADRASVETVSNTIFPQSLWNPAKPRKQLFDRYLKILPMLRQYPQNRRGLYFERFISYPGARGQLGKNQLDHIIQTLRQGNRRRSAFQMGVLVPEHDLNNARQLGFPCLQQVAFAPNIRRGTLAVTGFYAMQYLFGRAYGNYLGLIRLGQFVAREMALTLSCMTCFSAVAKLEPPLSQVKPILERFLPSSKGPGQAGRAGT